MLLYFIQVASPDHAVIQLKIFITSTGSKDLIHVKDGA